MKSAITNNINFDPTEFVNTITGEVLNLEYSVTKKLISDEVRYKSKQFLMLDTDALKCVKYKISYSDIGALIRICENVCWTHNYLQNSNNTPHTTSSIAKELEITSEGARKILKKLVLNNILIYAVYPPSKIKKKIYILNPSFLRKGNKIKADVSSIFEDFSELSEI